MKIIVSALAAASILAATSAAFAEPAPQQVTTCTSSSKSAEVPTGSYTDSHGRNWAGFKADGTPPDSLATDSTSVSCTTASVHLT